MPLLPASASAAAEAPPEPVVVVEHLARSFGGRQVLRDVSFAMLPGQSFGITGANGSGKTVLLRLLAGLDRPSGGCASVFGWDTVRSAASVRRRIGYVPEEPTLYQGITAHQYLDFVGRTRGLGRLVRATATDTLLQVVGLDDQRRDRDVRVLSPGERRRLALAAALVHEPDLLLLDDPLRGLDGRARLEQLEVLRELQRLGSTLLLTSTRPEDLLELCDSLAVLRDGVIGWQGGVVEAEALATSGSTPTAEGSVRVRLELLAGVDAALALLSQRRDLRELELDEDGHSIWFRYSGGRDELAALLPQLVRAGCTITHFGIERRSAASTLASLFEDKEAE